MKKTILAIVGAVVVVVILFVVAAVGGVAYFVRSHMNTQQVSSETASDEFARTRAHFAGQHPMIERNSRPGDADDDDRYVIHHPEAGASHAALQSLHALAYDRRKEHLVRINVPFWLLRMAPSGKGFSFMNDSDIDLGRTRLTVEDLERHGPGLILDTHDRHNADVLVWVE
jgi:hypothetical protein